MGRLLRLLLLAAVVVTPTVAAAAPPAPLRIDFISVGQGDAALVTSPSGKIVLIDGGPREAGPTLTAALRARHATAIDLVVLTHRHEDHLGGLIRDRPDVSMSGCSWTRRSVTTARSTRRCSRRWRQGTSRCAKRERNRTIDLGGGATITLLTPPDPPIAHSRSDVNANSVDRAARLPGRRRPVRGGRGAADGALAADASDARLPAQVLKVAHHGGRYSSTAKFLRAVRRRRR